MADNPHIMKLPTELQQKTIDYLNPEDVRRLRSVSRELSGNADKAFIQNHITERRHVLDEDSLKTLNNIIIHAKFGKQVQSVVFNSALGANEDEQFGAKNKDLLIKIFAEIKRHGTRITIGIADVHLQQNQHASVRTRELMFSGARSFRISSAIGGRHQSPERIVRFVLDCAEDSSCSIGRLELRAISSDSCRCGIWRLEILRDIVKEQLVNLPELSFGVRLIDLRYDQDKVFTYDHDKARVTISRTTIKKSGNSRYGLLVDFFIKNCKSLKRVVRELDIKQSTIYNSRFFRKFLITPHFNTLECINYDTLKLSHRRHWSSDIRYLSRLPNLKRCSLKYLSSDIPSASGHDNFRSAMIVNPLVKTSGDTGVFDVSDFGVAGALEAAAEVCKDEMEREIQGAREEKETEFWEHGYDDDGELDDDDENELLAEDADDDDEDESMDEAEESDEDDDDASAAIKSQRLKNFMDYHFFWESDGDQE